jgi:hypothetical protein
MDGEESMEHIHVIQLDDCYGLLWFPKRQRSQHTKQQALPLVLRQIWPINAREHKLQMF